MYKAVVAYTVKTWSFTKRDSQNTLNSSRSQFLKVSQNLQKNTNTGVSQDPLPEFLLKKRPRHRCFSVKFLKHLFYTTPPGGYFWFVTLLPINWGNKSDWMYFFATTLEAVIQNNLTKSWQISRQMSAVEFRYSIKL